MKLNKYSLIVIAFLLSISSCKKDFLEIKDTRLVYRQSFVKDLNSMNEFVSGIYIMLAENFEHGYVQAYPDLVADNLKPASSSDPYLVPHYNWNQKVDEFDKELSVGISTEATAMNPYWLIGYRIIRACNFVVEDISKYRNENPAKADDIKGQALALRAYVHFCLVNVFAQTYKLTADASHPGVPYITTSDISKAYSRQTVAQVYDKAISDLKDAAGLLAGSISDSRIMNRNAAKAFLARIYLFKEDFVNAKAMAIEVANNVPLLSLANGYPDELFNLRSAAETESLFQIVPDFNYYYSYLFNIYLRDSDFGPLQFVATSDLATILLENPNDARHAWVTDQSGKWGVVKFPLNLIPDMPYPELSYYPVLIRSSEMFLTVSEASAKSGDESTARSYLDAIRKRADPGITSVTASGPALLDSIYKERRKELCFESLRMYDLQRWKAGVHRIDALPGAPKDLPYPSSKAIAPIPPSDVKLMGIPQNIGY